MILGARGGKGVPSLPVVGLFHCDYTETGTAGQRAAAAAGSANAWGRAQFGVDVEESMGAVVDRVNTGVVGDRPHGYEAVGQWDVKEQNTGVRSSG